MERRLGFPIPSWWLLDSMKYPSDSHDSSLVISICSMSFINVTEVIEHSRENLLVPCLNDWSSRVTFSLGNSDPTSFGNAHMKIQWNCTLSRNKRTMTNDYHYKIESSCRFYLLKLGDEEKWRGWVDSDVEQFWHLSNANFRALVLTWPNYSLGLFESQALLRWFFLLKVRVMRGPRKKSKIF